MKTLLATLTLILCAAATAPAQKISSMTLTSTPPQNSRLELSVPSNSAATAWVTRSARLYDLGPRVLSPAGGGSPHLESFTNAPAQFGQIGMASYGNLAPYVFVSGSTNLGDWRRAPLFPAGIVQVGDVLLMDSNHQHTVFYFNGNTNTYDVDASGFTSHGYDQMLISANYSVCTNSSGSGVGVAVMRQIVGKAEAQVQDLVGASFNHVPHNRTPNIMPGHSVLVFNPSSTNNAGLAIAYTGATGAAPPLDAGLYSFLLADFKRHQLRFPRWVSGVYQPDTNGWLDTLVISPTNGTVTIGTNNPATGEQLSIWGGTPTWAHLGIHALHGTESVLGFFETNYLRWSLRVPTGTAGKDALNIYNRAGGYTVLSVTNDGIIINAGGYPANFTYNNRGSNTLTRFIDVTNAVPVIRATNFVAQQGVYYRSNSLTAVSILAGMTNGDFWTGPISNGLHAAWWSNNVANWKLIAP